MSPKKKKHAPLGVPLCYWINLDENTKRAEHMQRQFEILGPDWVDRAAIRVRAYDPVRIQQSAIRITPENFCAFPTSLREYGCTLSHLDAIWRGLHHPDKPAWWVVMEDDVDIDKDRLIQFDQIVRTAPSGWGILQTFTSNSVTILEGFNHWWMKESVAWQEWKPMNYGTVSYIIHRDAARRILEKFWVSFDRELDQVVSVDFSSHCHKAVADLILYQYVPTWTTTYPFHRTLEESSDIHPEHLSAHIRANGFIHKIQHAYPFPPTESTARKNETI